MNMHVNTLALTPSWLEHTIRDFSSCVSGGKSAVRTLWEDYRFGEGRFAFPAHLAVCCCSDLCDLVYEVCF